MSTHPRPLRAESDFGKIQASARPRTSLQSGTAKSAPSTVATGYNHRCWKFPLSTAGASERAKGQFWHPRLDVVTLGGFSNRIADLQGVSRSHEDSGKDIGLANKRPFNGNHTDALVDGEQGTAGFVGDKIDGSAVEASGRDGH
jgi:hypothetical protein